MGHPRASKSAEQALPRRVLAVLEPGGAQLSALRLHSMLPGWKTRPVLVGQATAAGLSVASSLGVPVEVFEMVPATSTLTSLQWTPSRDFAEWLRPRIAHAPVVHAHMFGAWWAAANAVSQGTYLAGSEHNEMTWPDCNHSNEAAVAARRLSILFAHGPAARVWASSLSSCLRVEQGRSPVLARDKYRPEPKPGRITFAGRFHREKGVDTLLDALDNLSHLRADWSARIVGAGPMESYVASFVQQRLRPMAKVISWSARPEKYLARSSVHVVPSREEAWSQSAVMAMQLRVPVVGTRVDGLQLTLGQGRGILVPPDNPYELARAVDQVLAGESRSDTLSAHRYAATFEPTAVMKYYLAWYALLPSFGAAMGVG